jgi:hypothetical protein
MLTGEQANERSRKGRKEPMEVSHALRRERGYLSSDLDIPYIPSSFTHK